MSGFQMPKKKKALIVTRVSGFVPQFEMNNVKILQQMGYEVHYAANFDVVVYGKGNDRLEGTGIICHHIPFGRSPFSPGVIVCCCRLKKLMRKEKFDLIHCHMPMSGVIARIAAQAVRKHTKKNIPVLYTAHGFHFYTGAPLRNWIYYFPEKWLAKITDCLITMNEEDYQRALSFPVRGSVEKIPGVGIAVPKEDRILDENLDTNPEKRGEKNREQKREQKRRELGFSEHDYVLISVGELNANKNHIQILKALAALSDPGIKYLLCGQGVLRETLEQYVEKNHLEAQVVFAGYRSDIEELLAAADLFVFPSLREGLPVALMEAMRAGLPVAAKKIRGNVDLIQLEKGGILLEEGSVDEYARAIGWFKENRRRAAQMGEWNRRKAGEYSQEAVTGRMREIYGKLQEPAEP